MIASGSGNSKRLSESSGYGNLEPHGRYEQAQLRPKIPSEYNHEVTNLGGIN